jgi:hypothetical protein
MEKRPNPKGNETIKALKTKNMRTFRTQFDPNYAPSTGEINLEPSQTVPDQSLSIRTLLLNHSRGIPLDVNHNEGQYFEHEIPQINDITDLFDNRRNLHNQKAELDEVVKSEINAKKQKEVQNPPKPTKPAENAPEDAPPSD